MSRIHKKILGLFSLVLVLSLTIIAIGLPTEDAVLATSQDVTVKIKINQGVNPNIDITSPVENTVIYDNNPANITIDYTDLSSMLVNVTDPDGVVTPTNFPALNPNTGTNNLTQNLTKYGEYTISVSGVGTNGVIPAPKTIKFSYHAITASDNGNGNIHVNYGPAVCVLGFQVYKKSDTSFSEPLLETEYLVSDLSSLAGAPNFADIEIPGFAALGYDKFTVKVTGYDCSPDPKPLQTVDIDTDGIMEPPKTGILNILGLTVSHIDYVLVGVIAFLAILTFTFFFTRRKKRA